MTEKGILYFAKGEKFSSEAEISAKQAKEVMDDIPITIVTDTSIDSEFIDNVIIDDTKFSKSDKPRALLRTNYESTLYLDSDIWLHESISEVFDLLNQYELGLIKDPLEPHVHDTDMEHPIDGVPEAFPEFNSGLMIFKNVSSVMDLFRDWAKRCSPDDERDQRTFRPALYYSDVQFTSLPPRYNCMYREENSLNGKVKVFHGQIYDARELGGNFHAIELEDAIRTINNHYSSRVSYRYKNRVVVNPPIPALTHFQYTLQNEGLIPAIYGLIKYVSRRINGKGRDELDNR